MSNTVKIIGGAPTVNLGARNFSSEMDALGVLSWCTIDHAHATVSSDRVTAVAPRSGGYGLMKTADSDGPLLVERQGFDAGKMVDDTLCYLYCPAQIDEAEFSLAMIWNIDEYSTQSQDLMACYANGNSIRLWHSAGYVTCRAGSENIASGTSFFNAEGPMLSIISASDGTVKIRSRSLTETEAIITGARTPVLGADCLAVFGADEVNDGETGAAPSSSRAMRDTIFDTLVFDRDILADPADPALLLIDEYFERIYANA